MAPLVRQCAVCAAPASPQNPMSSCSQCRVVVYCSREHQKADFASHKSDCQRAKQCRELIAREEIKLRNAEPEMFRYGNVLEEGHFWGIHETRPYMRAKFELIRAMSVIDSHAAISTALAEAMNCLRLCRCDNMGVCDGIPSLLLLLGKLQECYNFCKWWSTCEPDGRYDWGNMKLPHLNVKDADMTESLEPFKDEHSPFFFAGLAYVKMTLAIEVQNAVNARIVADEASLPTSIADSLSGYLAPAGSGVERSLDELKALHKKLEQQALKAFKNAHTRNKHYWTSVLDPMLLAHEPDPGYYQPGNRFEIKLWVMPNAMLWRDSADFIKENLKNC